MLMHDRAVRAASNTGSKTLSIYEDMGSLYAGLKAHIRRCIKSREVKSVSFRPMLLGRAKYVLIMVVRNEASRLEHILKYYEEIGIEHAIIIDNESSDNTAELLEDRNNVSLFKATGSYKKSRFGIDWINFIASKYCNGKWLLHVDADEYLTYPEIDRTKIPELTSRLEFQGKHSLQCIMLDMYSEKPTFDNIVAEGQDPIEVCNFFDKAGYTIKFDRATNTTWIKGGVRSRIFFSKAENGPALNKTPLVLWRWYHAYLKSSHQLWPYSLNGWGCITERTPKCVLLHFKFLSDFNNKVREELRRKQHTHEYKSYVKGVSRSADIAFFDASVSVKYEGWESTSKLLFPNDKKID